MRLMRGNPRCARTSALFAAGLLATFLTALAPPGRAQSAETMLPEQSAAKAQGLIQQAITALGGPAYLSVRDVECTGRVPIHGSGVVRYTPTTLDGEVNLIGETQGLRLKTRSFVSGRRLGPCNK